MKFENKIIFYLTIKKDIIEKNTIEKNYWLGFLSLFPEHAFDSTMKKQFVESIEQAREQYKNYQKFVRSRTRNVGRVQARKTIERMCEWYGDEQPMHRYTLKLAMNKSWGEQ